MVHQDITAYVAASGAITASGKWPKQNFISIRKDWQGVSRDGEA
jgi:hypothetical protein